MAILDLVAEKGAGQGFFCPVFVAYVFVAFNPRRRLSCLTGGYAMAGLQTLLLGHPLDLEAQFLCGV